MKKIREYIGMVFLIILYLLYVIIERACDWYNIRFGVSFEEILFTITSPLVGADVSFLNEAVAYIRPYLYDAFCDVVVFVCVTLVVFKFGIVAHVKIREIKFRIDLKKMYKFVCFISVISLLSCSVQYAVSSLALDSYIARKFDTTTIYEDYYIDPNKVNITCENDMKNIIYIYLESMETTYASVEDGGAQSVNYIPGLTELAKDNVSFSDTELLGGAQYVAGTGWTMAALFSTTTGIPFSFPIEGNSMGEMGTFASGTTSLGDVLEEFGYNQKFLCGSDGNFAGRKDYFEQHGNYEVLDYAYAVSQEYIPSDYYVWWGYEDAKLYDIAKVELLKLAEEDAPFNFTMLTVDTHHVDGYICEQCGNTYGDQLANVVECADNQVYEFVNWCKEQEFYKDTVIVIVGDHFRMDSSLVAGQVRRIYNCIINSDKEIEIGKENRIFTPLDFFPTVLSAMGYNIEGNRLGLGTDLYSETPTLAEELGLGYLDTELGKYSNYYIDTFK